MGPWGRSGAFQDVVANATTSTVVVAPDLQPKTSEHQLDRSLLQPDKGADQPDEGGIQPDSPALET